MLFIVCLKDSGKTRGYDTDSNIDSIIQFLNVSRALSYAMLKILQKIPSSIHVGAPSVLNTVARLHTDRRTMST